MFLMKMGKERRSTQRLALHPGKAVRVHKFGFGKRVECRHELVKDPARVSEHLMDRPVFVGFVQPGVNLIVGLQVRWPGRRQFCFAALRRLQARHRSSPPAGQVGHDIFD